MLSTGPLPIKMCIICGTYPSQYPNGACAAQCALCLICGARPWTLIANRSCEYCTCNACGATRKTVRYMESGPDSKSYCLACVKSKWPELMCLNCDKHIADIYVRKTGWRSNTPAICHGCKIRDARCWWCNIEISFATFRSMQDKKAYLCCASCQATKCCFKDKCRPPRPCARCVKKANLDQNDKSGKWIFFKQDPDLERYTAEELRYRTQLHSKRLLSMEIEVAKIRDTNVVMLPKHAGRCACGVCAPARATRLKDYVARIGGSIVYDESLGEMGFEINMPPAAGNHFMRLTQEVSDLLYGITAYVDPLRCGTHLHIDARDYTSDDMRKLLFLYSKIEPALLWTQPSSRVMKTNGSGSHCRPCGWKYKDLDKIDLDALKPKGTVVAIPREYGQSARRMLTKTIYEGAYARPPRYQHGNYRAIQARYDALNVHSWFFRGTVEVRLHAGTIDAEKMQKWGTIWASILDKAVEMSMKEVIELPDQPKEVLFHLVPSSTHAYLMNRWNAFEKTYEGKRY